MVCGRCGSEKKAGFGAPALGETAFWSKLKCAASTRAIGGWFGFYSHSAVWPGQVVGGVLDQGFPQLKAVAGKVKGGAVDALLEMAAGVERLCDGLGVAAERVFLAHLEVGGQPA